MPDRWEHHVKAFNTATESTNKIHDDEVARRLGFAGGLVPGVDVWAYLVNPCLQRWGDEFLRRGHMELRLHSPVYDGDRVVAALESDGTLRMIDSSGEACATGTASLFESAPEVAQLEFLDPPELDQRPPASEDTLAPGTTLGTLELHFRAEKGDSYLAEIRETDPRYAEYRIAHPGWLARLCNTVLWRSVVLGPWIHVSTSADHLGIVGDDEPMEVRARVVDEYERAGHRFVDLDVVITAEDRPVFAASHTAIWRPRQMAG